MFSFSSLEIELAYLIAKADYAKHKIATAKSVKRKKELEQKLKYTIDLINQLQNRISATIN